MAPPGAFHELAPMSWSSGFAPGPMLAMRAAVRHRQHLMQIILSEFISLDGVVQAPGGKEEDTDGGFQNGGWSMPFFDPEAMGPVIGGTLERTEALLFGRRTWEVMAGAWPERAGDPFADRMNSMPKYVASRSLTAEEAALRWDNTTLLGGGDGDAIDAIRSLKATGAEAVLGIMGSSALALQLVEHDLVDEYLLMIEPIILGGGKTIFPTNGKARPLELVSMTQAKTGVLVCTYRPAAPES
jgi:dihydrofolate reductase